MGVRFRRWSLPVLLLIAVVVPSACVLWFMNEAVEHQAAVDAASRRRCLPRTVAVGARSSRVGLAVRVWTR